MNKQNLSKLINKYNRPGPRYTSYPAYPHWRGITTNEWLGELERSSREVDLYIHIPYCESLCTYCGCTRTISRDKKKGERYADALIKEWTLYQERLSNLKVNSIHFGGGTPTFLAPKELRLLLSTLIPNGERLTHASIELDPRVTTTSHLEVLTEYGLNRFSLGIQDFDPEVQKAINRIQSFELTESLLTCINDLAPNGRTPEINFDLIYGLPLQTKKTIEDTIKKVTLLAPDTIALYGYAHVPWRSKAQKSLEKYGIPAGEEKLELYLHSKELLQAAGYKDLGLDHFAKVDSELYKAFTSGQLKRNFMGYTTQKSEVLIGLGASSIGNTKNAFAQNEKEIESYIKYIEEKEFPITHGHVLDAEDIRVGELISEIMCSHQASLTSHLAHLEPENAQRIQAQMREFVADGIIAYQSGELSVLAQGSAFLRNICMVLDHHFSKGDRFSQTI